MLLVKRTWPYPDLDVYGSTPRAVRPSVFRHLTIDEETEYFQSDADTSTDMEIREVET